MKKIFFFICITLYSLSFSQGVNVIEYKFDILYVKDFKAFVVANNTDSYFFFSQDKNMSFEKLDEKDKNINPGYVFKYNYSDDYFLQTMNSIQKKRVQTTTITKDFAPKIDWKITNDKRKILEYNCILATTTFRCRNYKVWFTPEIPLEIFPWKLKGLPGAVLAFEEEGGAVLYGEATRIIRNSNAELPKKLGDYFNDQTIDSAISYKEFIKIDDIYLEEVKSREIAEHQKGVNYLSVPIRAGRLEMFFEWETQPANR